MKITKFAHSCILIEHDSKALLLDPGIYSWQSGLVDVTALPKLEAVIVTHRHPDHLGEPFVKALLEAQPDVLWIAPADSHDQLRQLGALNVSDQTTGDIEVQTVEHAKVVPFGVACQNLVVHCFGLVTSPGDTHDFTETKDILLLPVQAPWGTTIRAFELGQELQPKYLIPIHDWMWNDEWRATIYQGLERVFTDSSTSVLLPTNGQAFDIDI